MQSALTYSEKVTDAADEIRPVQRQPEAQTRVSRGYHVYAEIYDRSVSFGGCAMWEELTQGYFFSADSDPKKADELFLQRYCSELTLTNIKKANLDVASLRHALSKISELLPELDHATPGWSAEGKDQLLVCFGKAHLQNRGNRKVPVIRKPRFGLCAVDGAARIWADDSFIFGGGHEESDYEWFDLGACAAEGRFRTDCATIRP